MINIISLIKEHGDMTFEELADLIGSGIDYIDLEMKLQRLVKQEKLKVYMNRSDVRVFTLNHPEHFNEFENRQLSN